MKKLKLTITAIALCFATISASATEEPITKKELNKAFRSKIVKLMGDEAPSYLTERGQDVSAKITLMLNNKNQVIVVSVDSKNDSVEEYVKSKLNYQKISVKGLKRGEIYKVPLTIKQS